MSLCKPRIALLLLALGFAAAASAAEELAMLRVDAIAGLVQVERNGQKYGLHEGETLQARDVLSTDARGRATLGFSRHGFIELGSNASVSFDALPESSYRGDLKTVFNLGNGYLRVVWKRPPAATPWPLYVVMGNTRAVLGSGEYFFQTGREQRLCAAAGVLAVQTGQALEGPEQVRPPACAKVKAEAIDIVPRDPDDWLLVRRAFSLNAGEPVIAEVAPSVTAPAPTAAVPLASSADMPPPKPGFDYSLLEEQPALATLPPPPAPKPAPAPVAPAAAAEPISDEAGKNTRYEVAASPAPAEPEAPMAAIPNLAPVDIVRPQGAAAAHAKGQWRINVASSTEEAEARTLLAKVQAAGLTARIARAQIHGRDWYRVQVGAYASADAAKAASGRVASALGLASVWFAQDK